METPVIGDPSSVIRHQFESLAVSPETMNQKLILITDY
jgi:hypothetical protein